MKSLALDVGKARIGVAVTDDAGILASPLETVYVHAMKQAVDDVAEIIAEQAPGIIYIGLPYSDEGGYSEAATYIREYAKLLSDAIHIIPQFIDERYTTKMAHQQLHELGRAPSMNRDIVDQMAAVNILELALAKSK